MNQCCVCVTGSLDTPVELQGWQSYLEGKGYKTLIKEHNIKGTTTYSLYRGVKDGECDSPTPGYWKLKGEGFCRAGEVMMQITDSVCPNCGIKHRDKNGSRTFCKTCRPASRKSEGYGCPKDGSSMNKPKRSNV